MNLQPIQPPLHFKQRVQCSECFKMVLEAKADMDQTGSFVCSLCEGQALNRATNPKG